MPTTLTAALPAGMLRVHIGKSLLPPHELFTFAARRNPRRAFLFLSKVLGKHLPVAPEKMAATHVRLAAMLPPDMPQPVLFIGMAETATALGQGIFEVWQAQHPGASALFLHSTRHQICDTEAFDFAEPHSHAPQQWLMLPPNQEFRTQLAKMRALVLVDDEMSTGRTLLNLTQLCLRLAPKLECVHVLCLTDFSSQAARESWQQNCQLPASRTALLHGEWEFVPHENEAPKAALETMAQATSPAPLGDGGFGRCGITHRLSLNNECLARWTRRLSALPTGAPVLVLGTGEFMFPAFKLALALQQRTAARVMNAATTRSPIELWGSIERRFSFTDNYGEGIANFLYNFHADDWAHTIICHETPVTSGLHALARHTHGALLHFGATGVNENLDFCQHRQI